MSERKFSKDLTASGVIITSTFKGEAYILLGVSYKKKALCHFHGWNDERDQPSGKKTSFQEACIETSSREYYEESLGVLSSLEHMRKCLQTTNYHFQILPRTFMDHCKCFWVYAGELGPESRKSVCKRFLALQKDANLDKHYLEVEKVVWIKGDEFLKYFEKQGKYVEDEEKEKHTFRDFFHQWFDNIVNCGLKDQTSNAKEFVEHLQGKGTALKSMFEL